MWSCRLSGRAVADRMRALHPGLAVLYMSGYTDDMVVRAGVVTDGSNFIQKPFTPEGLLARVRAALAPLIPHAIERGVPLFAVCRGFQEMNVALGGTLWQKVQQVPGLQDHREDKEQPLEVQYGPAHEIELVRGGLLHAWAGRDRVTVNSLHSQGVQTLGRDLEVEARAPDGLVEAFRVRPAPAFALAVQWHPECQVMNNPFSRAMFAAFGDAARARSNSR